MTGQAAGTGAAPAGPGWPRWTCLRSGWFKVTVTPKTKNHMLTAAPRVVVFSGQQVARTAQPHSAIFLQLSRVAGPGDEVVAKFWGLTGWSMNLWMVTSQLFAVLLVLPFMLGLRRLYGADLGLCGTVGVLLAASFWTRPALVIAVTRQRRLLCCRVSRPFPRKRFSQGAVEAVELADFRPGWLFSRVRYRGPGTDGKMVQLNVPAACRQAAQSTTEAASGLAIG